MGVAVMVVLGFAALAVDVSFIAEANMQVQAAADSASHAALVAHRNSAAPTLAGRESDAKAAAQYFLNRNEVALGNADLDAIRYGVYDASNGKFCEGCGIGGSVNSVELDVSRRGGNAMGLLLAPLIGFDRHEVAASATSAQQTRAVMLIQDFSCSMNGGGYPRPIDISREASTLFLDYMTDFNQAGDKLGLAGYAEWAVLGPPVGGANVGIGVGGPGGYADVEALSDATFARATLAAERPFAELVDVAEDQTYLREMFKSICSTDHGCPDEPETNTTTEVPYADRNHIGACTNPAIAMRQATAQITAKTDASTFRAMIVMSDGVFNCGGGYAEALAAANEAWDTHSIHVWTVLFFNGGNSPAQMQGITRGIGTFNQSPNVDDLPTIYAEIAASLPTAIVD